MAIFDPTLTDVLEAHLGGYANNFGVATPGIVVKVNNTAGLTSYTKSITVQPAVHKLVESEEDEDEDEVEEYSPLQEVPVVWPQGRGFRMRGKLLPGDTVLLVCLDRDASAFMRTGQASEPEDVRTHDWAHCVALPGLVPDTSPYPAPADAAALASKLDQLIGILRSTPESGAGLIKAAVDIAFPLVPSGVGTPNLALTTTGSKVLGLEE